MKKKSFIRSLNFNIIMATTVLLFIFCIIVSTIGYIEFTSSFTRAYTESAFRTAYTASTLIQNPDDIDWYLEHKDDVINNADSEKVKDYYRIRDYIQILCDKQETNVIYVFKVDTSDYKSIISVFDCINEEKTKFTPWGLGQEFRTADLEGELFTEDYRKMYEEQRKEVTGVNTDKLNEGTDPFVTSFIPLVGSDGNVTAILGVQLPMSELSHGRREYMTIVAVFTVIFAVMFIAVSTLFMRKRFVNPLKKINAEAARFAKENSAPNEALSDKIGKINEMAELADSLTTMENETLKYIENLSEVISEKQRIGTELRIASLIQEGSVPSVFPPYPDKTEFGLFALMEPAKEVGGDFYDFFLIDDDHLALVIADVSGKGIPAALFMMVTKILINERSFAGGTPAEILCSVNDRLCAHNKAEMFVTVWLGILELSTGKLSFANAGHDDAAVYKDGKGFELLKSKHGLVLGAMDGAKYTDNEVYLKKGDYVFLYTDGVPEATDNNNKLFTLDLMLETLNGKKPDSPEQIIRNVREKIEEFICGAPQFDDITMVCLNYNGKNRDSIKLTAVDENLNNALQFVRDKVKAAGCDDKTLRKIELYVEELFVNVAHYAYSPDVGEVEIKIEITDKKVRITFYDEGKPYDPLVKEDPDITLSAEERSIGGLGIFLTKKLTDNLKYEYKDGKNILITEKNFE